MILPILSLVACSFVIAWIVTLIMKHLAPRLDFVDRPGGRKIHANPKPLGGGVAIFLGFALPVFIGLAVIEAHGPPAASTVAATTAPRSMQAKLLSAYWSGARERAPLLLGILLAALCMHVMGLWDDRRALGPYVKLAIQLTVLTVMVVALRLRALTVLDHLGLGAAPSVIVTVLWIAVITNAFNFLDNMDGLSAGVAAVSTAAFLLTTVLIGQWFVAAGLALLLGALLGFLCFNFNPASIFMGDSGSLVIGLLLGVMTVRTTFLRPGQDFGAGWYALFAPVIVLAVPLYDLIVVSVLRISRGKSPFVGDTNHLSHRLVARGMSRRTAVLCIYLITAATAVAAVILPHVRSTLLAVLIVVQTLLVLGVVAILEQHPIASRPRASDAPAPAREPETAHATTRP